MSAFGFELLATDGAARRGRLTTPHGVVDTPAFMPVGTRGTVKSLSPDDVREAGAQIVLGNTYHLLLRPGPDLVRELGGLHRFMAWDGPILTDSGGFQVFSLSKLRKLTEDGVEFRSPTRRRHALPDAGAGRRDPVRAGVGHHAPARRMSGLSGHARADRALAGPHPALGAALADRPSRPRRRPGACSGSSRADPIRTFAPGRWPRPCALGFAGYAIGGMAVGEPKPMMRDLTEAVARALPADQPRYLMGVGKPEDLVESVARGVDMFDCVLPTRNARNGQCFTPDGPLTLKQARFARDPAPLQEDCPCYACRRFSRAYLRHLFMADELLVYRLLSLHNLHFFLGLMAAMRAAIAAGAFEAFRTRFFARYSVSSVPVPLDDTERPEV